MIKLNSQVIVHPGIVSALIRTGHGARVMVSDINYAASTKIGPNTQVFQLAWLVGKPSAPEVLAAMMPLITVQKAYFMTPAPEALPSQVQDELRALLPGVAEESLARQDYYDLVASKETAAVIVTGENRRFGNVLLEMGAVLG